MKRLLAALLAVVLVCSMSIPAFAAEEEKENNVTVKYVTTVEGAYVSDVKNGAASISTDGVSVSVTGAPSNAKTLVVIPMAGDALSWIDSCVDGDAKAAYDIHFEDAEGNRIGANGVSVSVAVSGSELIVSSVNTSSTDKNLSSTTSGSNVSFTTDGSHYYVIYEKDGGDQPGPGGKFQHRSGFYNRSDQFIQLFVCRPVLSHKAIIALRVSVPEILRLLHSCCPFCS